MNQGFELREKVAALSQTLLDRHPQMPVLLREIYQNLRQQPENVTLLSEEEIAVIVGGLKSQTQTEFASAVTKSPSAAKSLKTKIASMGADAF
jgi:hypothetical protein